MAAVALLKFTQGALVGGDGEALKGEVGTLVTIENSDNTDVLSWQIDLVYTPAGSTVATAVPLAFNNNDSTPTATFTPDVPGSYRVVMRVYSAITLGGIEDVDIRVFAIAEPGHGFIRPPFQDNPEPVPLLGSGDPGEKPNETNFNGQAHGWAGKGGDGLQDDVVRRLDASTFDLLSPLSGGKATQVPTVSNRGWSNPGSVEIDDAGNVWVLNTNLLGPFVESTPGIGMHIHKVNPTTNEVVATYSLEDPGDRSVLAGGVFLDFTLFDRVNNIFWCCGYDSTGNNFLVEFNGLTGNFGPTYSLGTWIPYQIDHDGTNLWLVNNDDFEIVRVDPSNPGVVDAATGASTAGDVCIFVDRDPANYGDTNPRVYSGGTAKEFYRHTAVGTPTLEYTSLSTTTTVIDIIEAGGSIYYLRDDQILGDADLDLTFNGTTSLTTELSEGPFGVVEGTGSKLFAWGTDATDPQLVRLTSSVSPPTVDTHVALNTDNREGGYSFVGLPISMAVGGGFVWAPTMMMASLSDTGPGSLHKVNETSMAVVDADDATLAARTLDYKAPYGSVVQAISDEGPWDGIADIIQITNAGSPSTITFPEDTAATGKRVTVVDADGSAAVQDFEIHLTATSGSIQTASIGGNVPGIYQPYGYITIECTDGSANTWVVVNDANTSTLIRRPIVDPGSSPSTGSVLQLEGLFWQVRGSYRQVEQTVGTADSWNEVADCIFVDASAPKTVTLPGTLSSPGRLLAIIDEPRNAATHNITIVPTAGTINGAANLVLNQDSSGVLLSLTTSNNWIIVGRSPDATDTSAIHDNVAGEINAITEKTTPVDADLLLIEDSAASDAKKKLQIGNLLSTTVVSPAQITSNQNDYNPTGFSTAHVVRLDADAARDITGLSASATVILKKLINVNASTITLTHQDTNSTAANRFLIAGATDFDLEADEAVDIFYDATTARWRLV